MCRSQFHLRKRLHHLDQTRLRRSSQGKKIVKISAAFYTEINFCVYSA